MKKIAVMGLVGWNNYGEQFLAKCTEYLIGGQQEVEFIDFEPPHNPIGNMLYYMFIVLSRLIPVRTISDKFVWYVYGQNDISENICNSVIRSYLPVAVTNMAHRNCGHTIHWQ